MKTLYSTRRFIQQALPEAHQQALPEAQKKPKNVTPRPRDSSSAVGLTSPRP